jgi:patatin-like phospholipase/acyl hydrolase
MEKNILVLGGGGVKGLVTLQLLDYFSDELPKSYDTYIGTSVGAIIAAALAADKEVLELIDVFPILVKKIFGNKKFIKPKYSLENAVKVIDEYFGGMLSKNLKKKLIISSTDLVRNVTHYLKASDFPEMTLGEFVSRSFAAPMYFSSIVDEKTKTVWSDGGVGYQNLPIHCGIMDALDNRSGLTKLYAFGTGKVKQDESKEFSRLAKSRWLREVLDYLSLKTGGFARNSSVQEQVNSGKYWADKTGNIFSYYDAWLDKDIDLDDWKKVQNELDIEIIKE